jgi:hypothetical protein
MPKQELIHAFLASSLRLLNQSGFSLPAEATLLSCIHHSTSTFEMPLIVSDFSPFGGVGFNLPYCFEIPTFFTLALNGFWVYINL